MRRLLGRLILWLTKAERERDIVAWEEACHRFNKGAPIDAVDG
jgi:hypothetical protein